MIRFVEIERSESSKYFDRFTVLTLVNLMFHTFNCYGIRIISPIIFHEESRISEKESALMCSVFAGEQDQADTNNSELIVISLHSPKVAMFIINEKFLRFV